MAWKEGYGRSHSLLESLTIFRTNNAHQTQEFPNGAYFRRETNSRRSRLSTLSLFKVEGPSEVLQASAQARTVMHNLR